MNIILQTFYHAHNYLNPLYKHAMHQEKNNHKDGAILRPIEILQACRN